MALTTRLTGDGNTLSISISGRFDFHLYGYFQRAYGFTDSSPTSFVVDLSKTDYIDSSALGMLLTLRKHADGQGAGVQIINASVEVRKLLMTANFQKLFKLS